MASKGALLGLFVVIAGGAGLAYYKAATGVDLAIVNPATGARYKSAVFAAGQARSYSVVVPSSSTPTKVQAFRVNPGGSLTPGTVELWNLIATGDNYIMTSSLPLSPGEYSVYVVVTFADGKTAVSNTVSFKQE
jgi:hypothetical protein